MGKKSNEGTSTKRDHFQWSTKMDAAFIQAMLKEQDEGNRIDGTFTTQAYTNMVDALNAQLADKGFKKDHLKNRLKTLKDNFSQYYDIFRGTSLSGFAWNSETKLVEAEDEVWEALIKVKPEAAKWKKKEINHYEELMQLFARDRATGASAATAKDRINQMNNEQVIESIDEIDQFVEINEIGLENLDTADDFKTLSQGKLPSKLKPNKRKRKIEEEDDFTSKVLGSMDKVVDAINRSTKVMESSRPHVYSEAEIYNELEFMGMEGDEIENAYLFLVDHPERARALFGCPLHRRISMLQKMMQAEN